MISNTKDIWRLESKWSDHVRPLLDRSRPKVGRGSYDFFFNFTCAHEHSRQRSYKNYGKTRKTKGIYGKTRREVNYSDYREWMILILT